MRKPSVFITLEAGLSAVSFTSSPPRRALSPKGTVPRQVYNSCNFRFIDAQTLARHCAELASDRKAEDIVIMDLRGVSDVADFYVLCTAYSEPQLKAVRDHIVVEMRDQHAERPTRVEGEPGSGWIILDYTEVMVHVLHREKREIYALEQLWNDAPLTRWEPAEVESQG